MSLSIGQKLLAGLVIVVLLGTAPVQAASVELKSFYPAGGALGSKFSVTATGTFPKWPVQAWVSGQGVSVTAGKAKGSLDVSVNSTAVPGIYWVRLYDEQGASGLRPLIIGSLPETIEKEPNDHPAKAQPLVGSTTVNGRLEKSGDVDGYAIELKAGQTVVASMVANTTLGSPMDATLQVCSTDGFVVQQVDDGHGVDPHMVFVVPTSGTYVFRMFAFSIKPGSRVNLAGAADFIYRLTITTDGYVDHALPMSLQHGKVSPVQLFGWNLPESSAATPTESDSDTASVFFPETSGTIELPFHDHPAILATGDASVSKPQPLSIPATVSGRLGTAKSRHYFGISTTEKAQRVAIQVQSRSLGYPLDAQLRLLGPEGKVISQADDKRDVRDPELAATISAKGGPYVIEVSDAHDRGGLSYVYRMSVETPQPDFSLTVAAGTFEVAAGKELEIPVTILRKEKFVDPVKITTVGLPEGVTVTTAESDAKGATAKAVTLKVTGGAVATSGSFQIVGESTGELARKREAVFADADLQANHRKLWLTVTPSK